MNKVSIIICYTKSCPAVVRNIRRLDAKYTSRRNVRVYPEGPVIGQLSWGILGFSLSWITLQNISQFVSCQFMPLVQSFPFYFNFCSKNRPTLFRNNDFNINLYNKSSTGLVSNPDLFNTRCVSYSYQKTSGRNGRHINCNSVLSLTLC